MMKIILLVVVLNEVFIKSRNSRCHTHKSPRGDFCAVSKQLLKDKVWFQYSLYNNYVLHGEPSEHSLNIRVLTGNVNRDVQL